MVGLAAGGGLLSASVVHAQEPPNLGTLSFTPATGTTLSAITATTSGGCTPEATSGYHLRVTGPHNFDVLITETTAADLSRTDPFPAAFGQTMQDASALQNPPVPLMAGTYTVTLHCCDRSRNVQATYTGALIFTSPTTYATDAPSTQTTTVPAGDGSALPPAAEPPHGAAQDPAAPAFAASPQPGVDAPPRSGAGQLTSERTDGAGQRVLWLVLAGTVFVLLVVVLLVVVVVASRIRKWRSS